MRKWKMENPRLVQDTVRATGMVVKTVHLLCCKLWDSCQWANDLKGQPIIQWLCYRKLETHRIAMSEVKGWNTCYDGDFFSEDSLLVGSPVSFFTPIAPIRYTRKIMLESKQKEKKSWPTTTLVLDLGQAQGTWYVLFKSCWRKVIDIDSHAYVIFTDYSRARDSVQHSQLFKTLMPFP